MLLTLPGCLGAVYMLGFGKTPRDLKFSGFPYIQRLLGLPLFTHAKVFWWWPHLLVVCTLSTVFRSCYMEYCLSSTTYTMTLSSGGWAPMGTPRRSQSWGWGMCTPAQNNNPDSTVANNN